MRRIGLITAAVFAVAGLLWWSAARSSRPELAPAPAAESAAAYDEPQAEKPAPTAAAPSPAPTAPTPAPAPSQPTPATKPAPAAPARVPQASPPAPPEPKGPLAELQKRFASEPRDAGASKLEKTIATAFSEETMPPELLKSAQCHKTVCKLQLRWSAERNTAYIVALMQLRDEFGMEMALAPTSPVDAAGILAVDVYWSRLRAAP